MNKLTLLVIGLVSCSSLFAQRSETPSFSMEEVTVTFHGVTGNLIDYVEPPGTINEVVKTLKTGYHPKDDWILNEAVNPSALPGGPDQSLQKNYSPPASPTKALDYNWDGISNFNVSPADPTVDVGPNHVVQMTNGPSGAYIQVYSKTGTPIGSQVYFDNFMGMPAGLGDPIVLYDERADRWFLSEFSNSGNNLHIAISTSPDPSGSYYTYSFNSASGFPDYPKYSIWEDSYIMTANVGAPDVWALNRTAMLAGSATTAQKFTQNNYNTIGFQAGTPVSLLGTVNPPTNAPAMVMRMRDDAWSGVSTDALEIWEIDVDWVTPSNSTFSLSDVLPMNFAYDSHLCGYTSFSCIDQPGNANYLDPLREVLMNRIMYRNFGTHESIVCCHVTDVSGSDDAGIRWYELRRTGGLGGSWVIYQESTYSPDGNSRWMPTIGISESGNIGLAYNVSSSSVYPSIRYTGRKECDPLNQMTEPETIIVAGTANSGSNRYGDYNAMGVDPSDGETFYMTAMYNPNAAGRTRIAAFSIDACALYPVIEFDVTDVTINESDADVANGCLDYYVIDVPISIDVAPTQDADITVNVAGGTATEGVDFDLLNNTFTLNAGNMTGTCQVRVYNDAYVEGTETIVLDYTLNANGGDAYSGATNQTCLITINDDDIDLMSMTVSTIVFSHDFDSGMAPFTTVNNNTPPASNLPWAVSDAAGASSTAWTVPTSNTTNFAYINDDACDCNQNDVDLFSQTFDLSTFVGASLSFDSYYLNNSWSGAQELAMVNISLNGGGSWSPLFTVPGNGSWTTHTVDLSAYVGNSNIQLSFNYSDGTGWLYGWAVDNVLVTGEVPIGVQTVVNTGTGMEANLGPNETVHFVDPTTKDVMMTLENTSSWDYGCVTVEVDRSGTSASQFNTASASDFLHDKTFTVVPTNDNPTGTYNVTVYYTEAEVAGWEAATGNNRNNAEIIKVSGNNAIQDVNPGNYGSFTIVNTAASVGAFYSDVTFTSAFSTGFSGFGVGIYNPGNVAPTADYVVPASACEGTSVDFTDQSTGGPTSWDWDFGDGNTSTDQNPSNTYASNGTYTVTLTASNTNGSDVYTSTITINALPPVGASATSTSICNGSSTTLNATGASTYTWDNGAGSGSSVTVSPTSNTTYTVTGTDGNGCVNTDAILITVNPLPTISVTGSSSPSSCGSATGSVTIGASGSGNITWNGTASGTANGVTLPYTVTGLAAGTYNFTFTNSNGCVSNTTSGTVTDPGAPSAPIVTPGTSVEICSGNSETLTSSYASGNTWSTGANTQSIDVSTAGDYTVYYTDGSGCVSNSTTVTVTVNPNPTITAGADQEICDGSNATLTATGASTYSWDNGAGSGSSVIVSPTTTTTYIVTGTDANGCIGTDDILITVNPLPTVNITPLPNDIMCINWDAVTLVGSPAGGTFSGNGVSGTTFTPGTAGAGTHTITYTYTDGNGCTNQTSVAVEVDPCSGIEEEQLVGVILSPNPNGGEFDVIGLDNETDYSIYDARGRLIVDGSVSHNNVHVSITNVEIGSYYLYGTANGKKGVMKFIVMK